MKATHPPATRTAVEPAELLHAAALYLKRHGWTQGEFFDLLSDQPFPPACAAGAITIAAYGRCIADSLFDLDDPANDDAIRAMRLFAGWLDGTYDPYETSAIDIIGDYNDHETRTVDEVVDALRTAADEYAARPVRAAQ